MINVALSKAALAVLPGEIVALPKAQMAELLAEVEIGQNARRQLKTIETGKTIAADVAGDQS